MQLRILFVFVPVLCLTATAARAGDDIKIEVQANQTVHMLSRHLTGACIEDVNHEIYGGLYSQMIFGESFQEPPASPTIKGFKTYGGVWTVRDGVVSVDGAAGPKLVSDRAPFRDGKAGVELLFPDKRGQNAALLVRVSKPGTGADAFVGYEVALDPSRQVLRLARHRQNYELIKDVPCPVAVGRWIPLVIKLNGSALEILVDGKTILKHDDGAKALSAGTVALRPWHTQVSYRNLWVQTGEQAEPLAFHQAEAPAAVSGMWRPVRRGTAIGRYALVTAKPFAGTQSQHVVFESGDGAIGVENQGLNRWGQNFVADNPYEGYVWTRADQPTKLIVALESRDGAKVYAERTLAVPGGSEWQRLDFELTPTASDAAGRIALTLRQSGAVTLGHVFVQPGEWGRFRGLPVRRDVVERLQWQGITVLRYGGSMVNNAGYKWKNMIGPRDRRPPYAGHWYKYSSNGWGILDFMNLCEAASFEYIPAFYLGETPQDMADFIDYAKAPADSAWGRRRAADGHPGPYRLKYLELGNEERVDEKYAETFEKLSTAIWARDPSIILVVGDFAYGKRVADPFRFTGAASGITSIAGHQRILQHARRHNKEVWFDVHVWTDHPVQSNGDLEGLFSLADALKKHGDGAQFKVAIFEYNANNHALKRALANALATNAVERDGRVPVVTSANGLQPDKQNDNGWDQGLLFLNPSRVWLQPPGYLTQMYSDNYLPQLVSCRVATPDSGLDINAKRSLAGKAVALFAVNPGLAAVATQIHLTGFTPTKQTAVVTELSGDLEAVNTAANPQRIVPQRRAWPHEIAAGRLRYTFPPRSITVLRFE